MFISKNTNAQQAQYTVSKKKKIIGLLEKDVFKIVITKDICSNIQIFNSRFVNKIKNPSIDKAYEKSRLVI